MRLIASVALVCLFGTAAPADESPAGAGDLRRLAELRAQGRYQAAEEFCRARLAEPSLSAQRRAELTGELVRTYALHARRSPPAERGALWDHARRVVADFARQQPDDPWLPWVLLEGARAAVAQGQQARRAADRPGSPPGDSAAAQAVLRSAVADLRRLDDALQGEIRRLALARRPQTTQAADRQRMGELAGLDGQARSALAGALVEQSLTYPVGSPDHLSALAQAAELLATLVRQPHDDTIRWTSRLDQVECWRLQGDFPAASAALAALANENLPQPLAARLGAERIRLALARGRIDEALGEAGADNLPGRDVAPLAVARFEAYLAAWRRAARQRDRADLTRAEQRALAELRTIEQQSGADATAEAEHLLAAVLAELGSAAGPRALQRAAAGAYRAYDLDGAARLYDAAAAQAAAAGEVELAFDAALAAGTLLTQRGDYGAAVERLRPLALGHADHPRASKAHLLAIHATAQLAAAETSPDTRRYEQLLREHLAGWPQSDSASQVWAWLGRLQENAAAPAEAIDALRHVRPGSPAYPAALEALGRCYAALLASAADGQTRAEISRDARRTLAQAAAASKSSSPRSAEWARAVALAAARIELAAEPPDPLRAQRLLEAAITGSAAAPGDWLTQAQAVLIAALAAQGRAAEAQELLARHSPREPADGVALATALGDLRSATAGAAARPLAALELAALDRVLEGADRLDAATRLSATRRRAAALDAAGHGAEALDLLARLAAEHPRDGQTQEALATLVSAGTDRDSQLRAVELWRQVAARSRPGSPRWFRAQLALARAELALERPGPALAIVERARAESAGLGGAALKPQFDQLAAECARRGARRPARSD